MSIAATGKVPGHDYQLKFLLQLVELIPLNLQLSVELLVKFVHEHLKTTVKFNFSNTTDAVLISTKPSVTATPPDDPSPSNNTLPEPFGNTDMLPLDTDTMSEITGDVKVLFVSV